MVICYFIIVRIAGIAITGVNDHNRVVTGNHLPDYSYIYATATSGTPLIARCVTGLGPSDGEDNNALGGLYFNGTRIPNGNCNASTAIQPNGALLSNFVGVINLLQCGAFSTEGEGIYTCRMMDSSRMFQRMRLGIYLPGRSEFLRMYIRIHKTYVCIMFIHVQRYVRMMCFYTKIKFN